MHLKRLVFCGVLVLGLLTGLVLAASAHNDPPVGLSLLLQNGAMAPVTLVGAAPRYLQEIDLVTTVPSQEDLGLQPLRAGGELASLDWSGVEQVEEDWRPAGDGTFIRQRFYRQARWMERPSSFRVVSTDDAGHAVGSPLLASAAEDVFVRRSSARQITTGCRSQGDCTGAKFVVEGLVWRSSLTRRSTSESIWFTTARSGSHPWARSRTVLSAT